MKNNSFKWSDFGLGALIGIFILCVAFYLSNRSNEDVPKNTEYQSVVVDRLKETSVVEKEEFVAKSATSASAMFEDVPMFMGKFNFASRMVGGKLLIKDITGTNNKKGNWYDVYYISTTGNTKIEARTPHNSNKVVQIDFRCDLNNDAEFTYTMYCVLQARNLDANVENLAIDILDKTRADQYGEATINETFYSVSYENGTPYSFEATTVIQ